MSGKDQRERKRSVQSIGGSSLESIFLIVFVILCGIPLFYYRFGKRVPDHMKFGFAFGTLTFSALGASVLTIALAVILPHILT